MITPNGCWSGWTAFPRDAIEHRTGKPYRPETKASQIRFPNGARILALPANASTAEPSPR